MEQQKWIQNRKRMRSRRGETLACAVQPTRTNETQSPYVRNPLEEQTSEAQFQ